MDNEHEYTELPNTLEVLTDYIKNHGPFDGVVGFSQGATLAHMLASWCEAMFSPGRRNALMRQGHPLSTPPPQRPFRFTIGFAGWRGTRAYYTGFYEPLMQTPTLIVRGQLDIAVPLRGSEELLQASACGEFLEHLGTHYVPKKPETLERVADFVGRALLLQMEHISNEGLATQKQTFASKEQALTDSALRTTKAVIRRISRKRYSVHMLIVANPQHCVERA